MAKGYLTTGEAGKLLGVTPHTVVKLLNEGKLKGHALPGSKHRRIYPDSVQQFLNENNNIPQEQRQMGITLSENDQYLSVGDICRLYCIAPRTAAKMYDRKQLYGFTIPEIGFRRFSRNSLIENLANSGILEHPTQIQRTVLDEYGIPYRTQEKAA